MKKIDYRIEEKIADVCSSGEGWMIEINKVAFGNYPAKIDIRAWNQDHTKMGKGLRLSEEEFDALKKTLTEVR